MYGAGPRTNVAQLTYRRTGDAHTLNDVSASAKQKPVPFTVYRILERYYRQCTPACVLPVIGEYLLVCRVIIANYQRNSGFSRVMAFPMDG